MVVSVESRRLDFDWLMVQTGESLNSTLNPGSRLDHFLSSDPARYRFLQVWRLHYAKGQFFGAESFTPV